MKGVRLLLRLRHVAAQNFGDEPRFTLLALQADECLRKRSSAGRIRRARRQAERLARTRKHDAE